MRLFLSVRFQVCIMSVWYDQSFCTVFCSCSIMREPARSVGNTESPEIWLFYSRNLVKSQTALREVTLKKSNEFNSHTCAVKIKNLPDTKITRNISLSFALKFHWTLLLFVQSRNLYRVEDCPTNSREGWRLEQTRRFQQMQFHSISNTHFYMAKCCMYFSCLHKDSCQTGFSLKLTHLILHRLAKIYESIC